MKGENIYHLTMVVGVLLNCFLHLVLNVVSSGLFAFNNILILVLVMFSPEILRFFKISERKDDNHE